MKSFLAYFIGFLIMNIFPFSLWAMPYHHSLKRGEEVSSSYLIHSQRLKTLFVQFQKQYLNFEFEKAQDSLKKIVAMRFLKDWTDMERQIIATCYLRLAQMDELYRYQWIDAFFGFSQEPFIDEDLFPPPYVHWIRSRHKEYQAKMPLWYGQNLPEDIEAVAINGEVFNRLGFSRRMDPKFKYRITFIEKKGSDKKQGSSINGSVDHSVSSNFSMVLNGKDLMHYAFDGPKLIEDTDQKPPSLLLNSSSHTTQKSTLVSDNVMDYGQTRIVNDFVDHQVEGDMKDILVVDKGDSKATSSKGFWKSPWTWIVVGGVTTGLLLSLSTKSKSRQKVRRISNEETVFH